MRRHRRIWMSPTEGTEMFILLVAISSTPNLIDRIHKGSGTERVIDLNRELKMILYLFSPDRHLENLILFLYITSIAPVKNEVIWISNPALDHSIYGLFLGSMCSTRCVQKISIDFNGISTRMGGILCQGINESCSCTPNGQDISKEGLVA